jgi:hypothetical protein
VREAGDTVEYTLYWQPLDTPAEPHITFLHVLDAARNVIAQADTMPCEGGCPAPSWLPGEVLTDRKRLVLPPGARGQPLTVEVGVYRARDGLRLATAAGESSLGLGPLRP